MCDKNFQYISPTKKKKQKVSFCDENYITHDPIPCQFCKKTWKNPKSLHIHEAKCSIRKTKICDTNFDFNKLFPLSHLPNYNNLVISKENNFKAIASKLNQMAVYDDSHGAQKYVPNNIKENDHIYIPFQMMDNRYFNYYNFPQDTEYNIEVDQFTIHEDISDDESDEESIEAIIVDDDVMEYSDVTIWNQYKKREKRNVKFFHNDFVVHLKILCFFRR